jgi:ABC-type nickel/cobalt efflux system permease component RcnA
VRYNNKQTSNPLTFGLALAAGLGLILMITALAVGVLQGASADSRAVGFALVAGFALLVCGIIGWLVVVRPFDHFDDINVPKDTGHAHTSHETAIVAHDSDAEHAVEPVAQH